MPDKLDAVRLLYQQGDMAAVLNQVSADQAYGEHTAELYLLAANAGLGLKAYARAIPFLVKLQAQRPDVAGIRRNLSQCFNELGRSTAQHDTTAALELYKNALQAWPENSSALFNLGEQLRRSARPSAAVGYFERLLAIREDDAECRLNLAELVCDQGDYLRVEKLLVGLVTAATEDSGLLARLAELYTRIGDASSARQIYTRLWQRNTGDWKLACKSLLSLAPILDDTEQLEHERGAFQQGLAKMGRANCQNPDIDKLAWANFFLAYHGKDDRLLLEQYAKSLQGVLPAATRPRPLLRSRKLLALVSSGFRDCTVGSYFGPWVSGLRAGGFDILLLQLGPQRDATTLRLIEQAGAGKVCASASELQAELLAAMPDVVLYPELGMDHRLLPLAAQRLAPLQLMAWGHPQTSGLSSIDYFVSCEAMEPPTAARHYTESLLLLPGIGTRYSPVPASSQGSAGRSRFGLPPDGYLLLQPQSSFKLHVDNDTLMARVLQQLPDAKLLMFKDSQAGWQWRLNRRLARTFADFDVDFSERVILLPHLSRSDYLALNACCDVMLDSRHFSGGNTSLDALSAGLPIVTWPGEFMRGRQSMAMLQMLGLSELIANGAEDYIETVIRVCRQPGYRRALSEQIESNRHRVFNDERPIGILASKIAALTA